MEIRCRFSGRPNPRWELSRPDRLEEVARRLDDLPSAPDPGWNALELGGFLIYTESLDLLGSYELYPRVRIHQGTIEIGGRYFSDRHDLESWIRQNWQSTP